MRRPPALLLAVAVITALLGSGMAIAGAQTTGLSVDDPRHVERFNVYEERGLYAMKVEIKLYEAGVTPEQYVNATYWQKKAYRAGPAKDRAGIPPEAYVYAPVTALLQHAAARAAGADTPHTAERTPEAYTVRHLVVAGLSVLGVLAVGALGWLLLGNWRWGVVAAAVVSAVPVWTGYAMFNNKDIPVAVGHTLATLGLVLLATERARAQIRWLALAGTILSAGTVLMVGTRPAMWVSLIASGVLLLAVLAWTRTLRWRTITTLAVSVVSSFAVLFTIYPRLFSNPWDMLWKSAMGSADYVHLVEPNGRGYLFSETLRDWPLILLALTLFGTVAAIVQTVALLRARSVKAAGLLLVGSQAFTLLILIVLRGSHLYQGLRQVLFSIPAMALLATFGLATLLAALRNARLRTAVAVVAAAGLVLPTVVQLAMFPYQHSYINVAAELAGVHPDNDPLGTSYREFLPYVSEDHKLLCPQFPKGVIAKSIREDDCRSRDRGTLSTYWLASGKSTNILHGPEEFYVIQRASFPEFDFCRTEHTITRWRNLGRTSISRLVKCRPPAKRIKARLEKLAQNDATG